MRPLSRQRVFWMALSVSLLLHALFAVALGRDELIALLRPAPVEARPQPKLVRFELINTPESAEAAEPPEDSRFMSNRNARAQDQTPAENQSKPDQPRLEGEGKSHDLRQVAMAPTIEPMEMPAPQPELPPSPPVPAPTPAVEPPQPPTPQPAPSESPSEPPSRVQPQPAPAVAAPPRPPMPEPVPAPPPQPTPEVQPLPKKDPSQLQRQQVARLEEDIAALRKAMAEQPGRQTMSLVESNELANAEIQGEFSYGATKHFFGDYLLRMKDRVERQWIALLLGDYTGILHSRAVIDFKIYSNGDVGNMRVVQKQGDEYFPVVCAQAIKAAAPFDPIPYDSVAGLPGELLNKPLNIRFTFEYN